jgi:hypothetical protein
MSVLTGLYENRCFDKTRQFVPAPSSLTNAAAVSSCLAENPPISIGFLLDVIDPDIASTFELEWLPTPL